jgi:hypothetical protein
MIAIHAREQFRDSAQGWRLGGVVQDAQDLFPDHKNRAARGISALPRGVRNSPAVNYSDRKA